MVVNADAAIILHTISAFPTRKLLSRLYIRSRSVLFNRFREVNELD